MKRLMKKWMLYPMLALGCMAGFTACGDDDDTQQEPAVKVEFELGAQSVSVTAEGGRSSISYTLKNPGANLSIKATSDKDWVRNFKTNAANRISFDVEENVLAEAREAIVSVIYSDDDNEEVKASFTVKQEATDPEFVITLGEKGSSWVQVSMTPKDDAIRYLIGALPVEEVDGYVNDEAFFNAQIEEFQKIADFTGIPLAQLIEIFAGQGPVEGGVITTLEPNSEYYVYCFGFNGDELGTAVVKQKFTTPAATRVNNEIKVTVTEEAVTSLTVNVSTTTWDSYVMVYAPTEELADISDDELGELLLDKSYQLLAGDQEGLEFDKLTPNTDYTIVVMGRAGDIATTNISKFKAKTKEAQQSDITYSLSDKKYFDALELKERHPQIFPADINITANDAIIAANIKADGAKTIRTLVAEQAWLDEVEKQEGRELTDEDYAILATKYGNSAINILTIAPYDTPLVIIGVVTDSSGNQGKLYKEELTIIKNKVSPVEEFDAYLAQRSLMHSILPKTDASSLKTTLLNDHRDGIVLKSAPVKTIKGLWRK